MKKHLIVLAILIAIVGTCITYAFMESGLPADARALKFDETRLSNFSSLQYSIETYYSQNKTLPATLQDLSSSTSYYNVSNLINDPETNKPYDYQIVSSLAYKLCTTFSTDSSQTQNQNQIYYYNDSTQTQHKKGYDCISYSVPSYYANTYPSQTVVTPVASSSISSLCTNANGYSYGIGASANYIPKSATSTGYVDVEWAKCTAAMNDITGFHVVRGSGQMSSNIATTTSDIFSYRDKTAPSGMVCYYVSGFSPFGSAIYSSHVCTNVP